MSSVPIVFRWVVLGSLFGLIALILYWNLQLAPPRSAPLGALLGLYLLPLLAPLPWVLRGRTAGYITAALISLVYLTHSLVVLSSGAPRSWPAVAEAGLALALLISASLQSRWQRMVEAGQAPSDE